MFTDLAHEAVRALLSLVTWHRIEILENKEGLKCLYIGDKKWVLRLSWSSDNLLQMYKTAGWSVGAEYAKYSVLCFLIFTFLSVAFH